jgi:hypothetical protein
MLALGPRRYQSQRGPRRPPRRSSTGAIAATAAVAVLAVVVVVLSYRVGHGHSGPSAGDFSELEARIDELGGQVNGMQAAVRTAAQQAKEALAKAQKTTPQAKGNPALAACLVQVQREVDDLQGYLAYRTPLQRNRVSGACLALLQPRFKG